MADSMNGGSDSLTEEQRRDLHGTAYVQNYDARTSQYRLQRLLPHVDLPPGARIADFGCGNARLLDHLEDRRIEYHGVDFSPDFIAAAKRRAEGLRFPKAEFYCGSITEFCERNDSSLDAGFAFDLSEHIYDDEWLEILRAVRAALRPGGRLYLHTPNGQFFVERLKARGWILKQFPEHVAVRTPEHNADLLKRAGLRVDRVVHLSHYNILRVLHPLIWLPLVGCLFRARLFVVAERPCTEKADG